MATDGSIVGFVAAKIYQVLEDEAKLLSGVKGEVESLARELTWLSSCLIDMENRHDEQKDETFRTALAEIRRIAYDAEDIIDSCVVEDQEGASKFKRFACFFSSLVQTHQLATQIEAIKHRIHETTTHLQRYQVQLGNDYISGVTVGGSCVTKATRPQSYPFDEGGYVVGLDEDINMLVRQLTSPSEHTTLMTIYGMGGSGKTTLARKLFNHAIIKEHFHYLAWTCVSKEWVVKHMLLEIIRNVYKGKPIELSDACSREEMVKELHSKLSNKLYMIVLDDVWSSEVLADILSAIPLRSPGSKVIVTTRNRDVVSIPGLTCSYFEPHQLTQEQSFELFEKISLSHRQDSMNSIDFLGELKRISLEMLKKCEGLPLAIIALGGVLSTKNTIDEWEVVMRDVISKVMDIGRGTHLYGPVRDMLMLSYNDLPHILKPCFSYLGLFPEDYEIPVGMLIRMWMAEGFITCQQPRHKGVYHTLEEIARQNLDELIQRCMVHVADKNYNGKVKSIKIHDLFRDMCIRLANDHGFFDVFFPTSSSLDAKSKHSRRAAIHAYISDNIQLPEENSLVRSLFLFGECGFSKLAHFEYCEPQPLMKSPSHTWKRFKLLRVLKLVGICTSNGSLSHEVGSLIHMRYLEIKGTNIQQLPPSIQNLRNLLTLDYRIIRKTDKKPQKVKHDNKVKLPYGVCELEQLRYLYLPFTNWGIFPYNKRGLCVRKLQNLKTLCIWAGGLNLVDELKNLSSSVRKLVIGNVSSSKELEAIFQCPSILLGKLCSLSLFGEGTLIWSLEPLFRCTNLQKLELKNFTIKEELSPIDQFPATIKKLNLMETHFESQETLRALGKLPKLRYLYMRRAYMGIEWTCKTGEFLQLVDLRCEELYNLREWNVEMGAMLRLKKLSFRQCNNLKRMPEGLELITSLQELHIGGPMQDTFYDRLQAKREGNEGEDVLL